MDKDHDKAKVEKHEEEGVPFFPIHMMKEMAVALGAIAVLITLAVLWPFHLHPKADPLNTPVGIKPEWYFLPMYQMLKYIPWAWLGVGLCGAAGFIFVIIPFIDRNPSRKPRERKLVLGIAAVVIFAVCILTFLGFICEREITVFGVHYEIDPLAIPHRIEKVEENGIGEAGEHEPEISQEEVR